MDFKRKLSSYDTATPVPGDDLFPFLQKQNDGSWRNKKAKVNTLTGTEKVFEFVATQAGAAVPTVTAISNGLGGTPAWSRTAAGTYRGNLAGAFPANKTFFTPGASMRISVASFGKVSTYSNIQIYRVDDDNIEIYTQQITNNTSSNLASQDVTDADGLLTDEYFKVIVIP